MILLGIDGCPQGWIIASARPTPQGLKDHLLKVVSSLKVLAGLTEAAILAIDIPIGLLERPRPGGRACDQLARKILGHPRRASIFSPPTRPALTAKDFLQARKLSGGRLNRQAYGLLKRIKEVDELIPLLPKEVRIYEVHPEVSFWALALGPLKASKHSLEGHLSRLQLLYRSGLFPLWLLNTRLPGAKGHDIADSLAALWTAWRIFCGRARRIPRRPPRDSRGLSMAIWF